MRTSSILALTLLLPLAAGCFLFHKESAQQQYSEALMRGNSMQASQLWLNMSPEDRLKFAHGEGLGPQESTKKDVQQMMTDHYQNQSGEGADASQTEEQMLTPLGAGLKDLPGASESSSPAN